MSRFGHARAPDLAWPASTAATGLQMPRARRPRGRCPPRRRRQRGPITSPVDGLMLSNALPEAAGDPPPAISSSRGALAMSAMRSRLASMWSLCRASFIAVLYARREALTGPAETVKCLQWYASITSRLSMACLVALVCTRGIGRGGPEPCGLLLCRRRRLRLCVSGAFYIEPRKSRRTSQDGSLLLLSGTPRSAPASPRRRHVLMSTLARKRGRRLLMVWRSRRLLRQQLLQRGSESRAASLLAARFASRAPQLGQVPDRGALVLAREHHGCREEVPGMTNVPRHGCVGDLMALAVVSCPGDTSLSSVAEILARRNVHAVFVLDDGGRRASVVATSICWLVNGSIPTPTDAQCATDDSRRSDDNAIGDASRDRIGGRCGHTHKEPSHWSTAGHQRLRVGGGRHLRSRLGRAGRQILRPTSLSIVRCPPDATVGGIARAMTDRHPQSVVVANDETHAVGVIRGTDGLALCERQEPVGTAAESMSRPIITAEPTLALAAAADLMITHDVHGIVVVDRSTRKMHQSPRCRNRTSLPRWQRKTLYGSRWRMKLPGMGTRRSGYRTVGGSTRIPACVSAGISSTPAGSPTGEDTQDASRSPSSDQAGSRPSLRVAHTWVDRHSYRSGSR